MGKSHKDIDLSVHEIHNAVDATRKGAQCRAENIDEIPCLDQEKDFWDWFFDW